MISYKQKREGEAFMPVPPGGAPGQILVLDENMEWVWEDAAIKQLIMLVTSPNTPNVNPVGGEVEIVNNGDGTYTLSSFSRITSFSFNTPTDMTEVKILRGGTLTSSKNMFGWITSLITFEWVGECNISDSREMFKGITELKNVINVDTSKSTTVQSMFDGCSKLTCIDGTLDFTAATNLVDTFANCPLLTSPAATGTPVRDNDNGLAGTWTNAGTCP